MNDYIRSFKKIIPSLRESTLEVIQNHPVYGEKVEIPIEEDTLEVFLHRAKDANAPVLFELHGGGFVLGHASKDDVLCELIKNQMNIHVVGINYRKAPEHPYPAAIEDVLNVMQYFARNADLYGMDKNRFAVMGFSAGANLATVACMKSKNKDDYHIVCQILHYPFLDAVSKPDTKERHPADLPCEVMEAFNELYSTQEKRCLPWISPIFASLDLLQDIAPAIILTVKDDALCKEGLLYGKMLEEAGVLVDARAIEYAHHGYIEDYYNKFCLDLIPDETKASYNSGFGVAAEEAIQFSMTKLEEYLK